jgi:hypothetical protein
MTEKPKDSILGSGQKTVNEREELINRLFCLINLAFSQVGKKNEDYLVLQQIHETKSRIIKEDPSWSFYNSDDYLIDKILRSVNAINSNKQWNHEENIEKFTGIRRNMIVLKEHNPHWFIDKSSTESHNPFLCHGCRKLKEEKMKLMFRQNGSKK